MVISCEGHWILRLRVKGRKGGCRRDGKAGCEISVKVGL